jgi:WD40 repeat protein
MRFMYVLGVTAVILASNAFAQNGSEIKSLTVEQAEQLWAPTPPNTYRRGVYLPSLESLTPEVAAALARSGQAIVLPAIKSLTPPVAEALAQNSNTLLLDGLLELPDDVAKELGKHQGALSLKSVSRLTVAACEGLSTHKVSLSLPGVKELPDEAVVALAKSTGSLELGLVSLTDAAAHALASRKWDTQLYEVKNVSDVAAEELLRANKSCSDGIKSAAAAGIEPPLLKFPSQLTACAFSHTGDMFAVGCFDGSVFVGDAASKKKAFFIRVADPLHRITGLGFTANSQGIVAVSSFMLKGAAYVINVNNEGVSKFLEGSAVHCMALDAKAQRMLVATQGPQSCVVNLFALNASDAPLVRRTVENDTLHCIGFCAQDSVAIGVGRRKAYAWHLEARKESESDEGKDTTSACISSNGRHLVVGGDDGAVVFLPVLADGTIDMQGKVALMGLAGAVNAVAVSHDGTLVAAGDDRNRVVVWRVADQSVVKRGKLTGAVRCLAFSPSGKAVVVGTGNFGEKDVDKSGGLYFLEF